MDRKKTECTNRYKEYLAWLKMSRIKAAKVQKEYKSAMNALADEAARRHREYLAEDAKREKKLEKMIVDN